MKNLLYFSFLFLALISKVQESIVYKVKYLPNHKYTSEFNTSTKLELHVSSSKDNTAPILAILPPGLKLPLLLNLENEQLYKIEAKPINKDKEVPFTIYFSKASFVASMDTNLAEPNNPLNDQKIYARIKDNSKVKLDSIAGKSSNNILETMVSDMLKSIQNDLQFPEKTLKPGDIFTQKLPLIISIPGFTIPSMDMKITYKLVSVKDGQAFFDLSETTVFNYYTKQVDVNLTGQGEGKMIFDIKNGFVISTKSLLTCSFTVKSKDGKREVKGSAKLTTNHSTSIE
jgi:hypothetical protein